MKTIWKYDLLEQLSIELPSDAKVLSVARQYGSLQMWVELDPTAAVIERQFMLVPTNAEIPDINKTFLGTVIVDPMVYHVFEIDVQSTSEHGWVDHSMSAKPSF
jgi:hypothetical protein